MQSKELKQKYLDYFKSKGHAILPSASLLPDNDPTALFTSAGMHPLVPYLMGQKHPNGKRLANVQKCIRTTDIDEVGNKTHHTFMEMLGNWSLGGYWKEEAIMMTFEFHTKILSISLESYAVSCFSGDENAPKDTESAVVWKSLGISEERIAYLGKDENWWGPVGDTGPCGPSTEQFYWTGPKPAPAKFDPEDKRWVEIGNDVLMEYNKTSDGKYEPLKQKNIDFGGGVERTTTVLNGLDDNYKTELFWPLIEKIQELSGKQYEAGEEVTRSMRIIADHLRAATFILGDENGVPPSNLDQGYVLRRLIRRAIRHGKLIGIKEVFCFKVAEIVVKNYSDQYSELQKNINNIIEQFVQEEENFSKTLAKGLKVFEKTVSQSGQKISGKDAFLLFSTYGFPLEMTQELAREKGIKVDKEKFEHEFQKHQELSRTASAGKFKGGLADASEETRRLHTANHLLLAALMKVLGPHVMQKGSNINPERLRLDFSHSEKMTPEQIIEVENLVNDEIQKNDPVIWKEMTVEEAKKLNAVGVFDHKYGDKVKVYFMGDFSKEICGGPHADRTGSLKSFKIVKEGSSSAGVRRIKAVIGQ